MINTPKVAVVILNWNGIKYLKQFLPSVLASTWPGLDIVMGDNASTDDSVSFIRENYPQIKVIQNDQNYGFTGGYNRVLAQVDADYYILLNSDVEVTPGWIEPVINLMEGDNDIAAAAPKLLAYAQKEYFEHAGAAGGFIDHLGYPFCRGRMFYELEADHGQYNQSGEIFWASGAALFIKKKYWDEAGGFDEYFFAHMEEIDLCWRLKNMGYKVMYCAQSTVYHVGGGTLNAENPFKTYLNFRNNLLLLKKNLTAWRGFWVVLLRLWMDLLALFRFLAEGKRKDAWAVSRAHQTFVLSVLGIHGSAYGIKYAGNRNSLAQTVAKQARYSKGKNQKGIYQRSIVWDFFAKKKSHFTDLDPKSLL